ncbi:MAG: T9SS type B sorting domain-containing protein, partial [Saprospiraceae bacterium]
NNCTIIGSATVIETPTLEMPQVSCGTITGDAITFIWADQVAANGFEVNVDNAGWISPSAPLAHTVSGLSLGETINIEVRGIGACNPPTGTVSCTTIDCSIIDLSSEVQHVSCNGQNDGSLTVTAMGDNAPFQYDLNGTTNTTGIFDGLLAGDYTVMVTDALGCIATTQLTVTEPMLLTITTTITTQETCDELGSAALSIEGGTAPFSIAWSDGSAEMINTNLTGGSYTVEVTDSAGCMAQSSLEITPYVDMTAAITTVDNNCTEPPIGSVTVNVQGGNGDYTYQWDDSNAQTTSEASSLIAGNYTVTITDASNCSITMMGIVGSPSGISIDSIVGTAVNCPENSDGQAIAYLSGGNGTINLLWENGQTTETATNLSAGSHSLNVTDDAGCTTMGTVTIETPNPIELIAPTITLPCPGDLTDLDLSVQGGTGAYTFNWNTGATTEDLADLTAGTYSVTVMDANNCTAMLTNEVQAAVNFSVMLNKTDIKCENVLDGAITTAIEGGNGPYNYEWSNGATTAALNNLSGGTYDLTVTDANNCAITATESIVVPNPVQLMVEVSQPSCAGSTGSILATAAGGTGALELIINGTNYGDQLQVDNLTPGNYAVAVKDASNCTLPAQNFQILSTPPIQIELSPEILIDLGDSITLQPTINNAVDPLEYFWETTRTNAINCLDCANPTIRPLTTTDFMLEVVDANGCIANASFAVRVNTQRKIYAPNAFSPNQDGINEQFILYGKQTGIIKKILIFDRWGNLVFEKANLNLNEDSSGWDGTYRGQKMDASVFVWFAEIEFIDGTVEIFKGEVTLVK